MKTSEYSVIGTRPVRHDGADKVTGRALYGADLQMAGMLHGHILRSPHAHARILRIDTRKAEALPGVKAIVTAADFPQGPDRIVDLGEGDTPLTYIRGNVLASGNLTNAASGLCLDAQLVPSRQQTAVRTDERRAVPG